MRYFVGIDVSQRQVSICVLEQEGKRLWRGKCPTDPAAITATLHDKVPDGMMTLGLDTALRAHAKVRDDRRLLMTVPGVGAITALAFASTVDDPARFRRS